MMNWKESTTKWFQIQNMGHNPSCLYKKILAGNLCCSPSPPHFVAEIWRWMHFCLHMLSNSQCCEMQWATGHVMQCDAMQHKTAEVWDCKNTSADEVQWGCCSRTPRLWWCARRVWRTFSSAKVMKQWNFRLNILWSNLWDPETHLKI